MTPNYLPLRRAGLAKALRARTKEHVKVSKSLQREPSAARPDGTPPRKALKRR